MSNSDQLLLMVCAIIIVHRNRKLGSLEDLDEEALVPGVVNVTEA